MLEGGISDNYTYYCLLASRVALQASGRGTTFLELSAIALGAHPLPIPPIPEQHAITEYLDEHCDKLDLLIAKKRGLIEKLREKRSALISQTVTRGLPPEAARAAGLNPLPNLKPSGVEWIGDIPEHWQLLSIGRIASEIQTGPFGAQLHQRDYIDDGIPLINPIHLRDEGIVADDQDTVSEGTADRLARYQLNSGDIVFARRGDIGRCALVSDRESGWLCGTGSMIVRLGKGDPQYFARVFRSTGFAGRLELNAVGTTMLNLSPAIIGKMTVPLPPDTEQHSITAFIDLEVGKIDRLIQRVEQAIARLSEYRTALITAAVTGKIDVREAVSAGAPAALAAEG